MKRVCSIPTRRIDSRLINRCGKPAAYKRPPVLGGGFVCEECYNRVLSAVRLEFREAEKVYKRWLHKVVLIAVIALLVACSAETVEPAEVDREALVAQEIERWRELVPAMPDCETQATQILWVPPGDVQHHVVRIEAGPVIQLPVGDGADTRHELQHWLQHCSCRWPDGDAEHADAEVW